MLADDLDHLSRKFRICRSRSSLLQGKEHPGAFHPAGATVDFFIFLGQGTWDRVLETIFHPTGAAKCYLLRQLFCRAKVARGSLTQNNVRLYVRDLMRSDFLRTDKPDGLATTAIGRWALDKYSHVALYARLFSMGMKDNWANRVYVDLCAGSGLSEINGAPNPLYWGSPLLALGVPAPF